MKFDLYVVTKGCSTYHGTYDTLGEARIVQAYMMEKGYEVAVVPSNYAVCEE